MSRLLHISGALRTLRRKIATFSKDAMADGAARAVPRAYARLNKLDFVQFSVRAAILPLRVRLLRKASGPQAESGDVVVLSVLRNGMPWLRTFLAHHRELGATHFVILDNGSNDGTREHLLQQSDVTLLASDAPYKHYENTFKRYLCDKFARERWCLFVDVDELLAYPGMDRKSLADLVHFTKEQGFDAVVNQMLDLFADGPMSGMPDGADLDLREVCRFYEIQDIERARYAPHETTVVPDNVKMHSGGIRKRVFGTDNGLTKVSLFFNGNGLAPFHAWHHARNARVADFTVALLHFPFNRQYRDKVVEAAASGRYGWLTTDEYRSYAAIMRDNPGLSLRSAASREYLGAEQLVAEGFLQTSAAFAKWAGISGTEASKPLRTSKTD
jgi:hypothetical protein